MLHIRNLHGQTVYADQSLDSIGDFLELARKLKIPCTSLDFSDLDLRNLNFSGLDLQSCRFDRSDIRACDFSDANLSRATFAGAKLNALTGWRNVEFAGGEFEGLSFGGV